MTRTDQEILDLCKQTVMGYLFRDNDMTILVKVYPSHSNADFAFCKIVALFTEDPAQILRIFDKSILSKRAKGQMDTYRKNLADKAISYWKNKYTILGG